MEQRGHAPELEGARERYRSITISGGECQKIGNTLERGKLGARQVGGLSWKARGTPH